MHPNIRANFTGLMFSLSSLFIFCTYTTGVEDVLPAIVAFFAIMAVVFNVVANRFLTKISEVSTERFWYIFVLTLVWPFAVLRYAVNNDYAKTTQAYSYILVLAMVLAPWWMVRTIILDAVARAQKVEARQPS